MARFLLLRGIQLVVVMFVVSTLLFLLLRASGDPVILLAGEGADPQVVERIREAYGFNDPLYVQYWRFISAAMVGQFGDSIAARRDAMGLVLSRVPASAELVGAGFGMAVLISIPLGVTAAVRRGRVTGVLAQTIAFVGQSVPTFVLGLLLILVFAVQLGWFPPFGRGSPGQLVLPAVTLGTVLLAKTTRLVRSGMLEVLSSDYVRTARAKGLSERAVIWRHALPNALIPVVTVLGLDLSTLIGGTVIVETIFGWPGLGRQIVDAIFIRDYPVVQAAVFLIAIAVVLINTAVDLVYRILDPRVRVSA
ncbi:MAG: ABC transporter permease [Chloroflexota bacterium]|nr:ABC transporter permease [Dehalococcoidia bacterium]MDW8252309.1 ABC transporter permease [Chloroflexota bacterium]